MRINPAIGILALAATAWSAHAQAQSPVPSQPPAQGDSAAASSRNGAPVIDRSVVLPGGRVLTLGDPVAPLRKRLTPRPDGKLAWIGPRLLRPAGAQLVVKVDAYGQVSALEIVYAARPSVARILAEFEAAYGPPGLAMPAADGSLKGASWQDGSTDLTVQSFTRPNGTYVVSRVCAIDACTR